MNYFSFYVFLVNMVFLDDSSQNVEDKEGILVVFPLEQKAEDMEAS